MHLHMFSNSAFLQLQKNLKKICVQYGLIYNALHSYRQIMILWSKIMCYTDSILSTAKLWFDSAFKARQNDMKISKKKRWQSQKILNILSVEYDLF